MTVFLALLPAYVLSIFYRSFLSVIANPVMADLGIGPREFGFLGAAWFLSFAVAQFPVGWALDRLGPRRTVAAMMALGAVGAFLFTQATSAAPATLAMALIGIGCAPVFMAALFLFARTQPPARFGMLSATFIGLGSLGNLLGASPLALAAAQFGWRATMLAVAAAFLLSALLAVTVMRDPPRAESTQGDGLLDGLAAILRIRALWLMAPLTLTGYAIVATVRGLWISPFMIQVHGLDAIAAGHVATVMALTMIAGAFLYGWLEKRIGRQKPPVLWGTLLTAACFAGLALTGTSSAWPAILLFAVIGAAGFTYAVLMSHARLFFPPHLIGRGITAMNFLFIAGASATQSGSGWLIASLAEAGPARAFAALHLAFAAALAVSAAFYAFAPNRRPAG